MKLNSLIHYESYSRKRCPVCRVFKSYVGPICPSCVKTGYQVQPDGRIKRIKKE